MNCKTSRKPIWFCIEKLFPFPFPLHLWSVGVQGEGKAFSPGFARGYKYIAPLGQIK